MIILLLSTNVQVILLTKTEAQSSWMVCTSNNRATIANTKDSVIVLNGSLRYISHIFHKKKILSQISASYMLNVEDRNKVSIFSHYCCFNTNTSVFNDTIHIWIDLPTSSLHLIAGNVLIQKNKHHHCHNEEVQ